MAHDYGIDLELHTFDRMGQVQEGEVLLQLKATARLRLGPRATHVPFRLERSDVIRWLAEPFPVILIVYDARKVIAYWLYVQSYFRQLPGFNLFAAGETITIRIPAANVLSTAAVRQFGRFRARVAAQIREVTHAEDASNPVR